MYVFHSRVYGSSNEQAKLVLGEGKEYEVGPAPEFGGKEGLLNPEEMIVGAVNSCLMMTFFYFVKKADVRVISYESKAKGTVEKGKEGLRFVSVEVDAKVIVDSADLSEKIRNFGQLAEKYCLVSRSLSCPVEYNLQVECNAIA